MYEKDVLAMQSIIIPIIEQLKNAYLEDLTIKTKPIWTLRFKSV